MTLATQVQTVIDAVAKQLYNEGHSLEGEDGKSNGVEYPFSGKTCGVVPEV